MVVFGEWCEFWIREDNTGDWGQNKEKGSRQKASSVTEEAHLSTVTLFPTKTGKPDANSLNNTVQQLCIGLFSQSKSVCIA